VIILYMMYNLDSCGRFIMNRLRAFALLVLCLSIVGPCSADSLLVTFSVDFGPLPVGHVLELESISGSFLWDTTAQILTPIEVLGTGPNTFDIQGGPPIPARFAPADNPYGYPAGSIIFFSYGADMASGEHAFLDAPVAPAPGGPYREFFFFGLTPADGTVTVTQAPVPEPGTLCLLGFGSFAMLSVLASKKLIRRTKSIVN